MFVILAPFVHGVKNSDERPDIARVGKTRRSKKGEQKLQNVFGSG